MVGGEIVFDESLIVLGENIQIDAKKLQVFGSFEQNISIFKILLNGPSNDLTIFGTKVAFGQAEGRVSKNKHQKEREDFTSHTINLNRLREGGNAFLIKTLIYFILL